MNSNLPFRYYLITDRQKAGPQSLAEVVAEACRAGVQAVQLREKDLSAQKLYKLARQLREVTHRFNSMLFINGRPDIAAAVEADGVHCPENGFPPATVRNHWPSLSTGVSVHSVEAARRAEKEGADFLQFGPVFYTKSKAKYGAPQGTDILQKVVSQTELPVYAVGGITPKRVTECLQAGAAGVSGISAIMEADDITQKTTAFKNELGHL